MSSINLRQKLSSLFSPPEASTSKKDDIKPRVRVREELHYQADIGARTYINLEQAEGVIEVIIPERSKDHLETKDLSKNNFSSKKDDDGSEKKALGYLGISNYEGTSWVGRLRGDLMPAMIPIRPISTSKHKRSILTFNYTLNPQAATIPTRPIFLEAQILDEKDRRDANLTSAGISFHDKLRLRLKITSEVSQFFEPGQEPILRKFDEAQKILEEQVRVLQKQLDNLKEKSSKEESSKDTNTKISKTTKQINYVDRKLNAYRNLLESYTKRRDRKNDRGVSQKVLIGFVKEWISTIKMWKRYNVELSTFSFQGYGSPKQQDDLLSQILTEIDELLQQVKQKVNLAYIEIKTLYIRSHYNDKNLNWHYNPQRQCLEQRESRLNFNEKTNLYEITLDLDIDPPIDGASELEGTLILQLNESISQLQIEWLSPSKVNQKGRRKRKVLSGRVQPNDPKHLADTSEKDEAVSRNYESWVRLDFTIVLDEIFSKREFMPLRQLHFEGVIPHPHHIANVKNILSNYRLTVLSGDDDFNIKRGPEQSNSQNNTQSESEEYLTGQIVAVRQGAYGDIVVINMTGRRRPGKHTIFYNDKQEQIEEMVTLGVLDINLIALMRRNSKEINNLLNSIQMDLEQYFMSTTESGLGGN